MILAILGKIGRDGGRASQNREINIYGVDLTGMAMLKILDDASETLFHVLDKVCISFGASENSAPYDELTDQNL